MARGSRPLRNKPVRVSNAVRTRGLTEFQTRRRFAQTLDRDGILEAARKAQSLGDEHLARGLVADLLESEAFDDWKRQDPYRPGDVMARVLRGFVISVDSAAREYASAVREVMPRLKLPTTILRDVARAELPPFPRESLVAESARNVVEGTPYDTALVDLILKLTAEAAAAREQEFNWLVPQLEIRFSPGDDGLGRRWRAASERVSHSPRAGSVLSRQAVERTATALALASDEYEIVAALAEGLEVDGLRRR